MALLSNQPPRLTMPTSAGFAPDLVATLRAADLRGRGGGGFPTATKIESCLDHRPRLIVNLCDGEPLVRKDETLALASPGLLADGVALVSRAVRAREVLFAVHAGSTTERAVRALLRSEPDLLRRAEALTVPARYVSSEATALASLLNGGDARPLSRRLPLSEEGPGRGRVAVLVLNAETCARVALIWSGQQPGSVTRLVTLSGAIRRHGVLEVDGSSSIADLVFACGGPTQRPRAVLLGGYGGTWHRWDDVSEAPLDALVAHGISLGAGVVHVFGDGCPLTEVGTVLHYLADESAGQCGPCMFGLPAIAADWDELARPRTAAAARERLRRRLPVIDGRGGCSHPDGAVRFAASALATFEDHLEEHRSGRVDCQSARSDSVPQRVGVR